MATLLHPVYNFSAGPAMLPRAILYRAKEEFLDWHGTGMSAMEFSHREDNFINIAKKAEKDLREIMNIPKEYKVLFVS